MRVVYYTHPAFLEPALHLTQQLAQITDLHLLMEVSPNTWRTGAFDIQPDLIGPGLVPADAVLSRAMPQTARSFWRDAASFHLVVHPTRRSLDPRAWRISHQVMQFIRSLHPDVVHLETMSRRLVPNLAQLGRVPLVLTLHDPELHHGEQNWRTQVIRRLSFGRVDRFVLHSQRLVTGFSERYGVAQQRIEVVHLGEYAILRNWLTGPIPHEKKTVLFFGRISAYKGLEVLAEAAVQVARSLHGVTFIIAGRPVRQYVMPDLPALPNGGRYDLLDEYIPNAQVAALFERATVVVCPYVDATQSGVLLTAYGFRRPVVATSVGGLPEYVDPERTGILVPPGNAQALAAALLRILTEPDWQAQAQKGITELVTDRLSWARAAAETRNVYAAVAARPSRA